MVTSAIAEPPLGYHPCDIGLLTSRREPGGGQCQAGSLTGAVASKRVSEAPKGFSSEWTEIAHRVQRQKGA